MIKIFISIKSLILHKVIYKFVNHKLTKGRATVELAGTILILFLTLIMVLGGIGIEHWFILSFIVFLATDAITGYRFENQHLRLLNLVLVSICLTVFLVIILHRFLVVLGILPS